MISLVSMREKSVVLAIEKIQGRGEPVSYKAIINELGCGHTTVYRAIKRLISEKRLIRTGTPREGYDYKLCQPS